MVITSPEESAIAAHVPPPAPRLYLGRRGQRRPTGEL